MKAFDKAMIEQNLYLYYWTNTRTGIQNNAFEDMCIPGLFFCIRWLFTIMLMYFHCPWTCNDLMHNTFVNNGKTAMRLSKNEHHHSCEYDNCMTYTLKLHRIGMTVIIPHRVWLYTKAEKVWKKNSITLLETWRRRTSDLEWSLFPCFLLKAALRIVSRVMFHFSKAPAAKPLAYQDWYGQLDQAPWMKHRAVFSMIRQF